MRIREIVDSDDMIWRLNSKNSFYVDYENLKRRYMLLSSDYDKSTNRNVILDNLTEIKDMQDEIKKMYTFCKRSKDDTETFEFKKSLKLMYNSCKEMIEELKKYL